MSFSLQQFSEVFRIRNADGEPYILIGGQAVNYWAERYLSTEPKLQQLQPFASQDIDFNGSREDVQRIARQLDRLPSYPAKVEMTALAGVIPIQIGNLNSSIEVVRRIPGVSGSVETLAVQAEWNGKTIRVLDPISLLASKLTLAATVPQKDRQDVAHLRILLPCVRAFLNEFLRQVERNEIPPKHWLGAANQVLKLTTSGRARGIARRHHINWQEILPLSAIAKSQHEKIRRFQELQLNPGYRKSKGLSARCRRFDWPAFLRALGNQRSNERDLWRLSGTEKPVIFVRHHPLIKDNAASRATSAQLYALCPGKRPAKHPMNVRAARRAAGSATSWQRPNNLPVQSAKHVA